MSGLLNRAALGQLRENPDALARLDAGPYSLMLIDVDHFKQVNGSCAALCLRRS